MKKNDGVPPRKTIESVLQEHTYRLITTRGVTGVAQGEFEGEPCIKVFVTRKTGDVVRRIPSEIEGYTVRVEESGTFRALGGQ